MLEVIVRRVQIRSLHSGMGAESPQQSANPHLRAQIIHIHQPIIPQFNRKETPLLIHLVQPLGGSRGEQRL